MKIRQFIYFIVCMSVGFVAGLKWVIRHGIVHLLRTYLFGMANALEADEASGIVQHVRKHFLFPGRSNDSNENGPVFCMPGGTGILGRTPHRVMVHTLKQKRQQDQVLELIRQYSAKNNLRTVTVQFFGNGNRCRTMSNRGTCFGPRQKQDLLRSETVK